MKKLILLVLAALMTVFGGCMDSETKYDGGNGISQNRTDKETDIDGDFDDDAEIDDDILEDIGKTVKQMIKQHGEITVSEWVNGPVYGFSDSDYWYAFSEYEITDSGYEPKGKCRCIILPLYELIVTPDGVIDTDTLIELSDSKVSRGYDDMDSMYYYEMTHDEYQITVYTDQNGEISGDSSARVEIGVKED